VPLRDIQQPGEGEDCGASAAAGPDLPEDAFGLENIEYPLGGGFGDVGRANKIRTPEDRSLENSVQGMNSVPGMGQIGETSLHPVVEFKD